MPLSYVLCATPRSGSTLLCDLLADAGAGVPGSYFRPESATTLAKEWGVAARPAGDPLEGERAFMAAVLRAGTSETGEFGFRLMWENLEALCRRLEALYPTAKGDVGRFAAAFGTTHWVHLSRGDKLAQAVSLERARQSGLWHRHPDGSAREQEGAQRPVAYDAGALAARGAQLRTHDAAWDRWFAANGVIPVRVGYEALAEDPAGAVAEVLRALGVDPGRAKGLRPRTARLAGAESRVWAERLRRR